MFVISDSGSITEEAGILKIPAISLRNDIERQEGMEETIVTMSEIEPNKLLNSIDVLLKTQSNNFPLNLKDYSSPNVSDKIVRIITSYISFINRRVWMKKQLKILIVSQYFWPENFRVNDIAKYLKEKGQRLKF